VKSSHSWIRRSQRVIRMVSELHRLGYQRLRIMPYEYPLAWRLTVSSAATFSKQNGAFIPWHLRKGRPGNYFPTYSSASEENYFEWSDCAGDNARALAEKFTLRFADVARDGKGRDWEYAGWLSELVGYLESGDILPFVSSESIGESPHEMRGLPIRRFYDKTLAITDFPLPPPGEAEDDPLPR
jgi:hypothetical protein